MAKKTLSIPFEGQTIKTVLDFNSEDLGLSIQTTISKDTYRKILKDASSGGGVLFGLDSTLVKDVRTELGEAKYKNYVYRATEDLSDSLSTRLESLEKDEIVSKIVMNENGTFTAYLNGVKIESYNITKVAIADVLKVYRKLFLGE